MRFVQVYCCPNGTLWMYFTLHALCSLLQIFAFWRVKPFYVCRHLLVQSFVVATLEAEQPAWCCCTLSHVRLCVFTEAGGRPGVWASLLLSLAALVKFSSITGWFNYFHPFTFNCVWQTLCSFESGCKVAQQSQEACQFQKSGRLLSWTNKAG